MPTRDKEIRFPMEGVSRLQRERTDFRRATFPAPWAANVRVLDNIERRQRGGSRPGLTKFHASDMGTTVSDIVAVQVGRSTGTAELLVVLVDSTLKVIESGSLSTPLAYLTNTAGNFITNTAGDKITVGTGSAPSSAFLVAGQSHVFAVSGSSIIKYSPDTGKTDTLVATAGAIPTASTFGAVYRDRLFLSGEDNAIYASRIGKYSDWDIGGTFEDRGKAIAFQLAISSEVGDKPTALIPHSDQNLICASRRSLWVITEDPGSGRIQKISDRIGIIGSRAWCRVDGLLYFLAEDGLYRMGMNGSGLEPVSEMRVPEELRDINVSTTNIQMGYERDRRTIHIYLRTGAGSQTHWNYEIPQNAFWPVRIPDDHVPVASCSHDGKLLFAGGDGYIRYVGGNDDDGTSIQSHVVLGPFRMGRNGAYGRLYQLQGMLASNSADVSWRIVVGDTADIAADNVKAAIEAFQAGSSYASYVQNSGTWSAGRGPRSYPRSRGVWCCLWLQSTGKWAFEGVIAGLAESGRFKG